MSKNWQAASYAVINALLVTLALQMQEGKLPVPTGWQWLIPIAVAAITALSPYIKIKAMPPENS